MMQFNNPKTWAGAAGIFGLALVICGMMVQMDTKYDKKTSKCEVSPWNIVTIVIGCLLVIGCFMALKKPKKGMAGLMGGGMMGGGEGASEASVSPEPTPGSMAGMPPGM